MSSSRSKEQFQELVDAVWTMTLATSGEKGPWSAPVYYLYREKNFYFFSSPSSRHIQEGEGRLCAASIFRDHDRVDRLEGLQMSGTIQLQKTGFRAASVAKAYALRFGITVSGTDFPAFFQNVFHACLYAFSVDQVFYMDNRKGFGNRETLFL
jgi:uncharacterized protein YhbP (UPF0306 family)